MLESIDEQIQHGKREVHTQPSAAHEQTASLFLLSVITFNTKTNCVNFVNTWKWFSSAPHCSVF